MNNKEVIRSEGEFINKAIFLPSMYNYIIGLDSSGGKILVPLKKK